MIAINDSRALWTVFGGEFGGQTEGEDHDEAKKHLVQMVSGLQIPANERFLDLLGDHQVHPSIRNRPRETRL
jgi:hypothetical protein